MVADLLFGAPCFLAILHRTLAMSCASGTSFTAGASLLSSEPAQRAAQPVTSTAAGSFRRKRLTARRLLASAREVTAQVWTTARSGCSAGRAVCKPSCWRNSAICWASYWLTLQPMASMWYVFMVSQFRVQLSWGQSGSGRFRRSAGKETIYGQ